MELTRVDPGVFTCASLYRAAQDAEQPARSYVLLAALGLCCRGPADWPSRRDGQTYSQYGEAILGYLTAQRAPLAEALLAGALAVRACGESMVLQDQIVDEYADFFGVTVGSSTSPGCATDTEETPS